MPSIDEQRKQLRSQLRKKRNALSIQEQEHASLSLLNQWPTLLKKLDLKQPQSIAFYLSNDGEISPHHLVQSCWHNKQTTFLPILDQQALLFAHYHQTNEWQMNRFGIKEPCGSSIIKGHELNLVFLPLVGFDQQGERLGMGGGFYDRTFANKPSTKPPYLIGLAHDCQQVKHLPTQSWDVPLDAIMTPSGLIYPNQG
ncbi:5-formyltetrahydrofolate cyclo-ligase [Marinomonas epiphytica]